MTIDYGHYVNSTGTDRCFFYRDHSGNPISIADSATVADVIGKISSSSIHSGDGTVTVLEAKDGVIDYFALYSENSSVQYNLSVTIDGYTESQTSVSTTGGHYYCYLAPGQPHGSRIWSTPIYFHHIKIEASNSNDTYYLQAYFRYKCQTFISAWNS